MNHGLAVAEFALWMMALIWAVILWDIKQDKKHETKKKGRLQ